MKKIIFLLTASLLILKGGNELFAQHQKLEMASFVVKPIDTLNLDTLKKCFDQVNEWITPEHCNLKKSKSKEKTVYILKCDTGTVTDIIISLFRKGYVPATTPYLIGLGMQYPEVQVKYNYILALDMNNAFPDRNENNSLIFLRNDNMRRLDIIGMGRRWNDKWWYVAAFKRQQK